MLTTISEKASQGINLKFPTPYFAAFLNDPTPPAYWSEMPSSPDTVYEKLAALIVSQQDLDQSCAKQQCLLVAKIMKRVSNEKVWNQKNNLFGAMDELSLTPFRVLTALSPKDYTNLVDGPTGNILLYGTLGFGIVAEIVINSYQALHAEAAASLNNTLQKIAVHAQSYADIIPDASKTSLEVSTDEALTIIKDACNKTLSSSTSNDHDDNNNLAANYEYRIVFDEVTSKEGVLSKHKKIRLTRKAAASPSTKQLIDSNTAENNTEKLGFWAKVKQEFRENYEKRLAKHQAWLDLQYARCATAAAGVEGDLYQPKPSRFRLFCAKVATALEIFWENPVWKVFATYPMAYWVVWMAGVFKSSSIFTSVMSGGLPLATPIMFAVPLIPGIIYLASKAYRYFKKREPANKAMVATADGFNETVELVPEAEAKPILINSLSVLHHKVWLDIKSKKIQYHADAVSLTLQEYLAEHPAQTVLQLSDKVTHEEAGIAEPNNQNKALETPWSRLKAKVRNLYMKWMDVISGVVGGFIWVEFAAWVGQDFFNHVIGLAASPSQAAIVTVAVFAAALVFGAAMGLYRWAVGKEQKEQIDVALHQLAQKENEYKERLKHFAEEQQKTSALYHSTIKKLDQAIKRAERENHEQKVAQLQTVKARFEQFYANKIVDLDEDNASSFRNHQEVSFTAKLKTGFKKFFNRTKEFIGRAGTGLFLGRMLFAPGNFLPQIAVVAGATATETGLIAGMSQPIFWAVVLSLGILYGLIKVVEYHLKRQRARDEAYLANLAARTNVLQAKVDYTKEFSLTMTKVCVDIDAVVNPAASSTLASGAANNARSWYYGAKEKIEMAFQAFISIFSLQKATRYVQLTEEQEPEISTTDMVQTSSAAISTTFDSAPPAFTTYNLVYN